MKNVIIYLVRSTEGSIRNLVRSIEFLQKNFLPWSPADILVFHEDGFDQESTLSRLPKGLSVLFAKVDFAPVHPGMENLSRGQKGYRHMCHFFANDIFERSELAEYDYYMRLDEDSFILSPLPFNLFEKMAREGLKYVYRLEMNEKKSVSHGLIATAEAFFAANPRFNIAKPRIRRQKLYYTNFEVGNLRWFRAKGWQRYFAAIDATGGIWRRRWGDAPIRWLGLQYLLKPEEMYCLKKMKYFHQFMLHSGFSFRLPHDYLRYGLIILIDNVQRTLAKRFRKMIK